jgi:predicted PurR-regulated permease PerM
METGVEPERADAESLDDAGMPEPTAAQTLRAPVDVRSVSLAVLAVCATVLMLDWAAAVFIPVLLGLMFSYALSPIVDLLSLRHVPRPLAAALLLAGLIVGIGATAYSLEDDANALIESLPDAAQHLRQAIRLKRGQPDGAIEKVQQAATQLEQAATESRSIGASAPGVTRVQVEPPRFNIKEHLWTGTLGLAALLGQATMVCFITFFLLASGDSFRRKVVRIAGPTFKQKRVTIETLDEITGQIKRYLLVQVLLSCVVGVATWLVFVWIGLQQAAVWGVLAGVLNLVPYLGAIAITLGTALVGFVQFGTLDMALLVAGSSFVIHGIVGYLLAPWLTGRASRMNPVVVFVGVLAWGWLWGVWGLLLGMPIMLAVKAVCDRVEDLKPVGELLGD